MPAKTCIFNQEILSMAIISQNAIKYILLSCQSVIIGESRLAGRVFYAKQSQFRKSPKEHKPLWKKGLRKRTARSVPRKQTQFQTMEDRGQNTEVRGQTTEVNRMNSKMVVSLEKLWLIIYKKQNLKQAKRIL